MRLTLVAAVLGLVGCAGGGSDPGSVVAGLTQQQIDQTNWLFNQETSDLVASADLQGPTAGYEVARVRLLPADTVVVYLPGMVGENPDVLRGGQTRPDGNSDGVQAGDDFNPTGIDDMFGSHAVGPTGLRPDVSTDEDFGLNRFDEGLLQALGGDEGYFIFHPGCA